jgi:hypothetical protein
LQTITPDWRATQEAEVALPALFESLENDKQAKELLEKQRREGQTLTPRDPSEQEKALNALKVLKDRRTIPALLRFAVGTARVVESAQHYNRYVPTPVERACEALHEVDSSWEDTTEAMVVAPELLAKFRDEQTPYEVKRVCVDLLGTIRFAEAALPLLDAALGSLNAANYVNAFKSIISAHLRDISSHVLERCAEIRACTIQVMRPVHTFVEDGADYNICEPVTFPLPADEEFLARVQEELLKRSNI